MIRLGVAKFTYLALALAWTLVQAVGVGAQVPEVQAGAERQFTLLAHGNPQIVFAGADVVVPVQVRNDGADSWSDEDLYRISYRWLDSNDEPIRDGEASRRTFLPRVIHRGEVLAMDAHLRTPVKPGIYRLRWDLVRERVGWFSAVDPSLPAATTVIVVPSFANLLVFGPIALILFVAVADGIRRRRKRGTPASSTSLPWLPIGRRYRGWCLLLIAALSVVTAVWIQSGRTKPTVFGDEALYTYKARNFAHHGGYFAPPGEPDTRKASAPFYSFFLAPIFLAVDDANVAFSWILLINALLHASMIYPAWKIAEAEFPAHRWLIAVVIAFWTIPASYSLSVMSEALFVPLFLWNGYLYLRLLARPTWARAMGVGAVTSVLLLTRFNGVAMLGVFAVICALVFERRGVRLARGRELLARAPMLMLPAMAWAGLRWSRSGYESEPIHSLYAYAAKSVVSLQGRWSAMDLVKVWLGELAYLNLASFNLLPLLLIAMVVAVLNARTSDEPAWSPPPSGLLPLKGFFLLASIAMLTTATVYMFTHLWTGKPRFLMYGRYADMVVPVVVVFALGSLGERLRPRWSWRWCLGAAAGLFLTMGLFRCVPNVGDTRVINMGAAWFSHLQRVHGMSWWVIAVPCACLSLALVAGPIKRVQWIALAAVLAVVNVQNTRLVEASHRVYAHKDAATWQSLEAIRQQGGRVLYRNRHGAPLLLLSAQYLLYDQVVPYLDGQPVDRDRDHFITTEGLMPARQFFDRGL